MVVAVVAVVLTPPASSSTHSAPGSHATRWLELASAPGPTLSGRPVVVTVDPAATIAPVVPADFLGLSFEAGNLPSIAGYADSGDLVNLLRSLGQGIMRFGGGSSDKTTAWLQEGATPPWAQTTIVPQDLAGLAGLARATGWRVLLTVNFGHYEPVAAAQEAGAAQAALGASLAGIAIGNEPDRYVKDKLRASPWPFADYLTEAGAYRAAIAAAAPGVPIVGPDSSSGGSLVPWVTDLATAVHPALLTDHYYPLTKCQRYKPKPSDLLSPATRSREMARLRQVAAVSHASAIPLRLDETNNVSCHGQPGVSNVFASALWAVDYIVRAMGSGVSGMNLHDLIAEPRAYSPLAAEDARALANGALHANPEWYALLLACQLVGDQPVQVSVTAGDRVMTAGAFLGPSGKLEIPLVDFAPPGTQQLLVRLRLPQRFGAGSILRLTAPGLGATAGVTLGGHGVSPAGTWSPDKGLPLVSGTPGSLGLEMPPSSAALVTLYPTG